MIDTENRTQTRDRKIIKGKCGVYVKLDAILIEKFDKLANHERRDMTAYITLLMERELKLK